MYTYQMLMDDCARAARTGLTVDSLGKTVLGLQIPVIVAGGGAPVVLITGGIHARESLSSKLVMRQAAAFDPRTTPGTAVFVPMVNPDGVRLCECGLTLFDEPAFRRFVEIRERLAQLRTDFRLFKANARGVDLNVNFPARWGGGVSNVRNFAAENYIGPRPLSEPESRKLAAFTKALRPAATVSYHCKGRELYWYFYQTHHAERDRMIAEFLNEKLRYTIIDGHMGSAGGYKDWCIRTLKIPALTIELIDDSYAHPLCDAALTPDIRRNLDLPARLIERLIYLQTDI